MPDIANEPNALDRLCQEARAGNKQSFDALVLATYDRAYSVALNMLRSKADAKDVVQDAFIRVQRGLPDFQGNSRFTTWLYRVVVNLCLDHMRHRKKWRRAEGNTETDAVGELSDRRQGPDDNASDAELRKHLEAGLATLSEAHRAVFLLFEVEGLSYEEIAQVTGARVGTVMSRLFYARKKMQQHLEPHLRSSP